MPVRGGAGLLAIAASANGIFQTPADDVEGVADGDVHVSMSGIDAVLLLRLGGLGLQKSASSGRLVIDDDHAAGEDEFDGNAEVAAMLMMAIGSLDGDGAADNLVVITGELGHLGLDLFGDGR